ncbi:unnamed protein product [Microthlaspi erraticum]|uniref:F-box domain-containing protein n=1 Tax=Microthlaspi erraticum TaxID=1685480 RepID=A0A6D2HXA4_9BRAS|nr:unnamed protein product [Microthlaspi erraticum]CAA7018627.1 unnamed protein product [Microthlaspi erraticum]
MHNLTFSCLLCRSETLKNEALKPSFADLPSCLIELIMSHLVLKDNIRASASCKSWREAGVSVRVVEKHPCLMCFPKDGSNLFEFRDPLQRKSYTMNLPELLNSTVCYSRDGWLLMHRWFENELFFFNPFSRELISLPKLQLRIDNLLSFSCPPTLGDCVVLALDFDKHYRGSMSTWHPGETEWKTTNFLTDFDRHKERSWLVYVNNLFYCTTEDGNLYYCRPSSRIWECHKACGRKISYIGWCKEVNLAEKKGELFVVFTYLKDMKPMVCKLVSLKWKEMSDTELDGLTFFVSDYNSEMRTDLPWIRNNICHKLLHNLKFICLFCRSELTPSNEALNPSFADLPLCLIEIIMSLLVLKYNICASAVCKSWREAAEYVRVVEKHHPWLMCFPKEGTLFEFRDPLQLKSYSLNLPKLAKSNVCCSRDGWLLMRKWRMISSQMFFFNPFSRELISLPEFELDFLEIAFSCPPTSDNCVVVALNFDVNNKYVTICTWHHGATEWIAYSFPKHGFDQGKKRSKLVYLNDCFYIFNEGGILYYFHPSSCTWNRAYELKCPYQKYSKKKRVYLAEKKGELFVMFTCNNKKPMVYRLVSLKWIEMSDTELGGLNMFVSFNNSVLRSNVYFSKHNGKRCVTYSFDESRYNLFDQLENKLIPHPLDTVWIDPPENVL